MIDFKHEISDIINKAILKQDNTLKIEGIEDFIETPPTSEMGDYAFPCFRLAKTLKKSPQIIATDLEKIISEDLDKSIIEKVEIVGGYLNFYINKLTLIREVLTSIKTEKEKYGATNIGKGQNAVIEYSSPNIAKTFHIGHLRSTVIGGALYKLYNFVGYNSIGLNYIGDWGLQFGKVMAGLDLWRDEYDFSAEEEISIILKIYVRFSKAEKENPELTDLARKMFKKLEDREPEAISQWEHIRKISLENYERTYNLLNAKFDNYDGEAYYNDKMEPVIKELEDKGLLKDSEGAKVVFLDEYDMPPCIIITSAGTTIYATRDIAALEDRIKKYNFAKMVYVVGSEQELHFKQVFKTLELAGYEDYVKNCSHVQFGLVVDKNGEKIGSRKGNFVTLEGILNESIEKVKKIIDEKNKDGIDDRDEIARKVGVGAVIFNDLSNSRIKNEIFDWDILLNFNGETGPYIQYIYVRTKSILNKAGYLPKFEDVDFNLLTDKSSIEVIKLLYELKSIIIKAVEKNEPSILARYLIDLAQSFSNFYNANRIIGEEKNIENARLFLTKAVGEVLKNSMALLGIEMPSRM